MNDYGTITLRVKEMIQRKGISKNKLDQLTAIKRSQLNRYCRGDVVRMDLDTIAKLCYALDCDVNELLHYERPEK